VNQISAYASVELNMDVRNAAFVVTVDQELEEIIANHCRKIVPKEYFHKVNLFQLFRQRLAYQTVRLLFFLFTFYFKQEKEAIRR
jgi:cardiolipin synthase